MELRLSPSFPTRSLSLGSHRRRWPGSRHLLQVFLRQTGAGAPQLSSARCYLAGPVRSLSLSASAHLQTEARPSPLPPGGSRCSLHDTPHAATQSWEPLSVRAQAADAKGLILAGARLPAGALPGAPSGPDLRGLTNQSPFILLGPRGTGQGARRRLQPPFQSLPRSRAGVHVPTWTAPCRQPPLTTPAARTCRPHPFTPRSNSLEPPYQPHPHVHTLGISAL